MSAEGGDASRHDRGSPAKGHFWPRFLPDGMHYLFQSWADEAADGDRRRRHWIRRTGRACDGRVERRVRAWLPALSPRRRSICAAVRRGRSRSAESRSKLSGAWRSTALTAAASSMCPQTGVLLYFSAAAVADEGAAQNPAGSSGGSITGPHPAVGGRGRPVGRHRSVSRRHARRADTGDGTGDIWVLTGSGEPRASDEADARSRRRHQSGVVARQQAHRLHVLPQRQRRRVREERQRRRRRGTRAQVAAENPSRPGRATDGTCVPRFGRTTARTSGRCRSRPAASRSPSSSGQFQKDEPQFSYDGKWLAYTSDESERVPGVRDVVPGREAAREGHDRRRRPAALEAGRQGTLLPRAGRACDGRGRDDQAVSSVSAFRGVFTTPAPGRVHATARSGTSGPVSPDGQRFLVRAPNGGHAGRRRGGRQRR